MMSCPMCGAALQRLSGSDGHLVDLVMDVHGRGTFERARLDAVYACPGCEFIGRRAAANERMRREAETEYRSASNTPIGIYARIQRRRT